MPHCVYGSCNSDSRLGRPGYDPTLKFYPLPQPCFLLRDSVGSWTEKEENKHVRKCNKCRRCWNWVKNCRRTDEKWSSVRFVRASMRICGKHFHENPDKMDFEKFIPVSNVRKARNSLYRRNPRSEVGTSVTPVEDPTPQPTDSLNSEHEDDFLLTTEGPSTEMIITDSVNIQMSTASQQETIGTHAELLEEVVTSIIEEDVRDEVYGVQKLSDKSVQASTISRTTSIQTRWKLADNIQLINQLSSKDTKISNLQAEIRLLTNAMSPIVTFEIEIFDKEKMCIYYTGFTPKELSSLIAYCEDVEGRIAHLRQRQGESNIRKLTYVQELLVMLLRLRGGLLVRDMSFRFGLSEALISRITTKWITALYEKFSSLKKQMFSSREMIHKHLPDRFRTLRNIRIIIDGAEVKCQRPTNFEQQGNCYSQYKAHTTYKFLLGCAPNGAITFISELFEGSISDRELVMKCGLVDMLEEGDLVLADRGFTIKDLTDSKGVALRIPAFLMGRDKLTPQEEVSTKEIAANRIFIEHMVGRLKNFRFLQRVIPQSMRHVLSQAVYVCGCLLNFQQPLLK